MGLDTSNWSVADWDTYMNNVSEEQNGTVTVRNAPVDNSANAQEINRAFHKSGSSSSNNNASSTQPQSSPGKKQKPKSPAPESMVSTKAMEKATGSKFAGLGKNIPVWQAKALLKGKGYYVNQEGNKLAFQKGQPQPDTTLFRNPSFARERQNQLDMLNSYHQLQSENAQLPITTIITTKKTIPGYEMKSSPLYSSPAEQSQKINAFESMGISDISQLRRAVSPQAIAHANEVGVHFLSTTLPADYQKARNLFMMSPDKKSPGHIPVLFPASAVETAGAMGFEIAPGVARGVAFASVGIVAGLLGKKALEEKKEKTGAVTLKRNSLTSQSRSVNVSIQKKTHKTSLFGRDYVNINKKKNQYKKTNKYDFMNNKKNQNRNRNKNNNGFDFFNPNQDDFLNRDILKDINTLKNKNKNVNENENENEDINENREETRTETETKAQDVNVNKFINENVDNSKPEPKKKKIPLFIPFFMRKQNVKKIKKVRKTRKELTVKEYIHPFGSFMGMRKAAAEAKSQKSHKKGSKKPWWRL